MQVFSWNYSRNDANDELHVKNYCANLMKLIKIKGMLKQLI